MQTSDLWRDASLESFFQRRKETGTWISRSWHFTQTVSLILAIGIFSTMWLLALDHLTEVLLVARTYFSCIGGNADGCIDGCECLRTSLGKDIPLPFANDRIYRWFLFVAWSSTLAISGFIVATSIGTVGTGSGIARMKSILSGIHIHHFLSLRVLLVKSLGVVLLSASGLPVGREGPFVHLACCISKLLMRIPLYRRYRRSKQRTIDMLTVCIACCIPSFFLIRYA